MEHELIKEWVKPELKVISFAKTSETVLVFSVQQEGTNNNSDNNPDNNLS